MEFVRAKMPESGEYSLTTAVILVFLDVRFQRRVGIAHKAHVCTQFCEFTVLVGDNGFTEVHDPASQAYHGYGHESDYQLGRLNGYPERLKYLWKEKAVK